MRISPSAFALALALAPFVRGTPEWTGNPAEGARELEAQWREIQHPRTAGIRGVFRFCVEAAGLGWHPERVERALALARSMQDLDAASKTYGNFRWRCDHTQVFDPNAVEFSMQLAGLLALRYRSQLSPEASRQLDELMTTAIEGIHRHKVPTAYTNIFLMKSWDLLALGEALHRPDIAEEGYSQFKDWLRYTATNGIAEYGGVTYYGVDLDSLAFIRKYAPRAEARDEAEKALEYFWTDIAANWWTPGERLACANSRSYDYLYGRGYLEAHTYTAGFLSAKPELESAGWLSGRHDHLVTFLRDATWVPPTDLTEPIREHLPRTVVERWSGAPLEQRATAFISDHVTLASSGNTHGSDERTLVADIGDSPRVPQLILFMDGRGDPYGTRKTENAANQAKSLHLTPFICTVQRGPEAIQVLSDEPETDRSHPKVFFTQITIPAQATVYAGGEALAPGPPDQPTRLARGQPVFVVLNDAVIAFRILVARACDGSEAPIEYISDGADLPARRITIVHSAGPPKGRGITAVWFRVSDGLDAARLAQFRRDFTAAKAAVKFKNDLLDLGVAAADRRLRIIADVRQKRRMELAGQEPDALLSVNGEDVGLNLLRDFGAM